LGVGEVAKMTLLWILIFGGMFLIVEWFMIARGTASALVQILHNVCYPS